MGLITHVLHVPKLFVSLVSIQRLVKLTNYSIFFDDLDTYICSKVNELKIGLAKIRQGLYYLPEIDPQSPVAGGLKVASVQTSSAQLEQIMELHYQMGHPSFYLPKQLYPHHFKTIDFESLVCDASQLGKFKRATYPSCNNRANKPFLILHCDVWGPSPHTDLLGHQYVLICTDDHSRFTWLFLLKNKSEVTPSIENLCQLIQRQFGDTVKSLRLIMLRISLTSV